MSRTTKYVLVDFDCKKILDIRVMSSAKCNEINGQLAVFMPHTNALWMKMEKAFDEGIFETSPLFPEAKKKLFS